MWGLSEITHVEHLEMCLGYSKCYNWLLFYNAVLKYQFQLELVKMLIDRRINIDISMMDYTAMAECTTATHKDTHRWILVT
jgi:hypothetical protein